MFGDTLAITLDDASVISFVKIQESNFRTQYSYRTLTAEHTVDIRHSKEKPDSVTGEVYERHIVTQNITEYGNTLVPDRSASLKVDLRLNPKMDVAVGTTFLRGLVNFMSVENMTRLANNEG
jgi:hypothetical protein